jgi:hypothetical protein
MRTIFSQSPILSSHHQPGKHVRGPDISLADIAWGVQLQSIQVQSIQRRPVLTTTRTGLVGFVTPTRLQAEIETLKSGQLLCGRYLVADLSANITKLLNSPVARR